MATIKQCKMLAARCKQAGLEYDFEAFQELSNQQVDEMLAKLAKRAEKITPQPDAAAKPTTPQINGYRFGMACKLTIEAVGLAQCLKQPDAFHSTVRQLYALLNVAERRITRSLEPKAEEEVVVL